MIRFLSTNLNVKNYPVVSVGGVLLQNIRSFRGVINSAPPMVSRFALPLQRGVAFCEFLYFSSRLSSLLSNT